MYICFTANPSIESFVGTISGVTNSCERPETHIGNFDLCPMEGEDVTINCNAIGDISITFSGEEASSSMKIINSFTSADSGAYVCSSEVPVCGSTSLTLDIQIICELHNNDTHMYM